MSKNNAAYIPILFIVFILTFVSVIATYIYIAHNTYSGVYTKNHYQKGVDFARANSSGIISKDEEVEIDGSVQGSVMAFQVRKLGKIFNFDDVKVKVIRPVNKENDRILGLHNIGVGSFSVDLSDLANGQWELRIKITRSGEDFYNKFRILKKDSVIKIKKAMLRNMPK